MVEHLLPKSSDGYSRIIELIFERRSLLNGYRVRFARELFADHLQITIGHCQVADIGCIAQIRKACKKNFGVNSRCFSIDPNITDPLPMSNCALSPPPRPMYSAIPPPAWPATSSYTYRSPDSPTRPVSNVPPASASRSATYPSRSRRTGPRCRTSAGNRSWPTNRSLVRTESCTVWPDRPVTRRACPSGKRSRRPPNWRCTRR